MRMLEWTRLSAEDQLEILKDATFDGETEVICPETKPFDHDCSCSVEPDGYCPCGCPSVLLVAGII